jgi:hypothetical protein
MRLDTKAAKISPSDNWIAYHEAVLYLLTYYSHMVRMILLWVSLRNLGS